MLRFRSVCDFRGFALTEIINNRNPPKVGLHMTYISCAIRRISIDERVNNPKLPLHRVGGVGSSERMKVVTNRSQIRAR